MKNSMLLTAGVIILALNSSAYANPTSAKDSRYETGFNQENASPVEFSYKINGVVKQAKITVARQVTGDPTFAETHYMNPIQQVRTITGSVESINTRNNTIVLKDLNDNHRFIMGLKTEDIGSLNKGDIVHATMKCVGSNFAVGIQK